MRYFNINQVEIERYYKEIYMRRRKDTMRKRYYGNDTYEREERYTNEKRYTLIQVGIRYESLKTRTKMRKRYQVRNVEE